MPFEKTERQVKVKFDDLSRFEYVGQVEPDIHLYTLRVNSVHLKGNIRLVYVLNLRNKHKPAYALLFSTDTDLEAETIYRYYKAPFQIEIVFTQMTKASVSTGFGSRDDVADFHLAVIDNHPINQQFHQLSFLSKGGLGQSL